MKSFSKDVKDARNGDTEAFARLYADIYKDLYHIALYSLGNTHDACDAVSDTVMDAFCSIGKLRNENAFRSWIMRILSAKIKNRLKEYAGGSAELDESIAGDFDYGAFELKEALDNLDDQSRLILSLSVMGGFSGKEIAHMCSLNEGTVRSRLSRIRKQLRITLESE